MQIIPVASSWIDVFVTSPIAKAWHKTWKDYGDVSSIHGMKYIYDKYSGIYLKVIWTVTVFLMFTLANRMAYSMYDFIGDPIRLIIESDHANTAQLLYPAVTVCPATLFNYSKAKEFIMNLAADRSRSCTMQIIPVASSWIDVFVTSPIAKAWHKTWKDYGDVSSIHGMKYIYDKYSGIYLKVIWTVTVFLMFTLANRMAYSMYLDFIGDPIRLIIESDHANTAQLLYPAVTVCPATLFNYSKAKEFIMNLNLPQNLTTDEVLQKFYENYGFINEKFKYNNETLATIQTVMRANNFTAAQFFQKTNWNCNELFFRCRFQSKFENCDEIFRISKTYAGFCCSFNAHQMRYDKKASRKFKSNRHAMRQGLSFILKDVEMDSKYIYSDSRRFQVLVHEAHVYPDVFTIRKVLHRNEELLLRADPIETICSREVWRRLTVEERKCALPDEISLRFFLQYHPQNCVAECLSLIVLKVCGCVPFHLFRETQSFECDWDDIPCLSDNFDHMLSMQKECKCFDSCKKVDFSVRLSRASTENNIAVVDPFYDDFQPNFTIVHVYLQSQLYRRVRRDIVWNIVSIAGIITNPKLKLYLHMYLYPTGNLGNCYSVFVGISALSVLQFLYYFTFVLMRNYYKIIEGRNITSNLQ